jgi:hypothetical protein
MPRKTAQPAHAAASVSTTRQSRIQPAAWPAVYRVRRDGSLRHVPTLENEPNTRRLAELVRALSDTTPLRQVAEDLLMSTSTARRLLQSLEITEEIENGEWTYPRHTTRLYLGHVEALDILDDPEFQEDLRVTFAS